MRKLIRNMLMWFMREQTDHVFLFSSNKTISDKQDKTLQAMGVINFQMFKADRGFVVKTFYYSEKQGEIDRLYIIKDEENLGDRMTEIITETVLLS